MGWLIAAGLLVALCLLPISIRAVYDTSGAQVFLGIGPVRIAVYPRKGVKRPKKQKASGTSNTQQQQKKESSNRGGKLSDFLPLLEVILKLVAELRRRLVIKDLEVKVLMVGEDPCDLSINYGRAWAAVGNLLPQLERLFILKKRNFDVACDYTADESYIFVRVVLSITLGRLLMILIFHGSRALKQYIQIINKRKGGAEI